MEKKYISIHITDSNSHTARSGAALSTSVACFCCDWQPCHVIPSSLQTNTCTECLSVHVNYTRCSHTVPHIQYTIIQYIHAHANEDHDYATKRFSHTRSAFIGHISTFQFSQETETSTALSGAVVSRAKLVESIYLYISDPSSAFLANFYFLSFIENQKDRLIPFFDIFTNFSLVLLRLRQNDGIVSNHVRQIVGITG